MQTGQSNGVKHGEKLWGIKSTYARSRSTDQNQLRISSRGFTTVTATSLLPRLSVTGITALSVPTSAVPFKHTMTKVMLSGRQTMTSMVISTTLTAAGSSFPSASQDSMRTKRLDCITTGSDIMILRLAITSARTRQDQQERTQRCMGMWGIRTVGQIYLV